MIRSVLLFIVFINSAIGFGQYAEFDFLGKTTHRWDKVNEGEILHHSFVFTNDSELPLTIKDAVVECSCTQVEFSNEPIPPGAKDSIVVTFDTDQKYYKQNRTITLKANTKREEVLKIKVFVIPKE